MDDGSGISLTRRAVAIAARLKTTRLQRLALMAEEDDLAAVFDECAEDEEQELRDKTLEVVAAGKVRPGRSQRVGLWQDARGA